MKKVVGIFVLVLLIIGCAQPEEEVLIETAVPATFPPTPTKPSLDEGNETPTPEPLPVSDSVENLAPDGVPGETYLAPFPVAITLDGQLADWAGVPRVTMPDPDSALQSTTQIAFAAAADENYLYLLADVIDPNVISGVHGENYWNEDSVELYLNGTGNLAATSYIDGIAQLTIPPMNMGVASESVILAGVQGMTLNAEVLVTETAAGYMVETAVPLRNDVWAISLEHGNTVGFQVHLNVANEADRATKYIWSIFDRNDSSYFDPSVFGQLVFFEAGQSEVAAVEPTATATWIPVPLDADYKNPELPIDQRVEDLLSHMTLEEKIGQMTLIEKNSIVASDIAHRGIGGLLSGGGGYPDSGNTPEGWAEMVDGYQDFALASRLGIPLIYGVDAVHGHSNVYGAVIYPHNIGLGAANNPELMAQIGRATAEEMIATGIYWNYAPAVSIPQDIRWGRTYEGYSENTALVSSLASAYIRGLQLDDLADPMTVLATVKHYVGDGGTVWGSSTTGNYQLDQGVTDIDEETLRRIHLPPYIEAIENGAQSIMISYSSWGGIKMHGQQYLITDVLQGELGFDGFIVSDWAGVDQISPDFYESVVTAINAGIDMNMVPYNQNRFIATLMKAVEDGDVPMARIDDAVRNILTVKFKMGLFENPYSNPALLANVGSDSHRAVGREAVAQSLVLLKNENSALPLSPDLETIFVAGTAANDIGMQSGGWTIEWQGAVGEITVGTTILEGIEEMAGANTAVIYDEFGYFEETEAQPDTCIVAIGEKPYAEGIGDSNDLTLPVSDKRLLNRLREACETLVVLLVSGRPRIVTNELENWDAFVAVWLPGTEGAGVADVLFGERPFTGKLPYTWPRSMDQLPFDFESLDESEPLFSVGFGLEN